jgi:hypothetical protein
VAERAGLALPVLEPDTLTEAVELCETDPEPLPVMLLVVDTEGDPVTE